MMQNPIYSREMKASPRSIRPPLIIVLFNGILSMVTLLSMHSAAAQVEPTTIIQYSSPMDMYELVITIEFIPLMLIVPAVTAVSISGERERQTLELTLITQMAASQVVIGKLTSALSTLLLLIMSNLPAAVMVSVYGEITWQNILSLLICYITVAFFVGSLGICFSVLFKRSAISTVATHGVLIAVVVGIYFVNKFSLSLSPMNTNNSVVTHGFGENVIKPLSGNVIHLLLINLAATFYTIISGQMGGNTFAAKTAGYFGMQPIGFVMENWIITSVVVQLSIAALTARMAIKAVEPVKRRREQGEASRKGD